ncbi:hypothetical protein FSP39_013424 [Pinctada imbricata]|uniref:Caveolin n=1 Tax=Pinctada imbricata TaxID=66713 RepID=A0AA89C6G0_PINIB|nr:hypothetical protein FSP39_013424 [Pinctada imbricata]
MGDIDMINRDPNNINGHLGTLIFTDVIGEVEGAHSIDCVYTCSYKCYECWKGLCYKIATLCCGICIAIEWGCEFAAIAFCHIWCISPCMKIVDINCGLCSRIYRLCIDCCCTPCYESVGGIFHHFGKK